MIAIASIKPSRSAWGVLAAIGFLRILIAPLLALAFVLSTFIASTRRRAIDVAGSCFDRRCDRHIYPHLLVRKAVSE